MRYIIWCWTSFKFWCIRICFLLRCFGLNKEIQLCVFFTYPFRFWRNAVPTRPDNRGSTVHIKVLLIVYKSILWYYRQGYRNGGGLAGYIPPNNLTVYPPTIWVWYFCIPSNNLTLVCIWAQVCTWIRGKKVFHCLWRPFFGLHLICSSEKSLGRGSSPMLKIGQNWGKIADHPPQCSTKLCTADYRP